MLLINGRRSDKVNAADRGLHYGDGLFETIAVVSGKACLWEAHMRRLRRGCERLLLPDPSELPLAAEAEQLLAGQSSGVLKLMLTRGPGGRGYTLPQPPSVTRILSFGALPEHPQSCWQQGVSVMTCTLRLASQPRLAGVKHLNRLEQVLARAEMANCAVAEGLMLAENGFVVEGTMSNLFCLRGKQLLTPRLETCGVAGVMRERVLELAPQLGLEAQEVELAPESLFAMDEVFLTNSVIGAWPVAALDGVGLRQTGLSRRLCDLLESVQELPRWLTVK